MSRQKLDCLGEVIGHLAGIVCSLDDGFEEVEGPVKVVFRVGREDGLVLGTYLLVCVGDDEEETRF